MAAIRIWATAAALFLMGALPAIPSAAVTMPDGASGIAPATRAAARAAPPEILAERYRIGAEDTLMEIARRHGLGYVEIMAANPGVDPWVPGVGRIVLLPTIHLAPRAPQAGIVINVADMRLYWWPPDQPPRSFPIGIGRDQLTTPLGYFRVAGKKENPTWYPTPRMRRERPDLPAAVPPGPDNPLGTHALYLNHDTYRIHGTNRPWAIGSRSSSGCIRLYPEDIPSLYAAVPPGTPVTIVDQEVKAAWFQDELYLEIHPSGLQADALEFKRTMPAELPADLTRIVLEAAGDRAERVDWDAVRRAGLERRGYPVRVSRPIRTEHPEEWAEMSELWLRQY